jgi:hypothetical protein
MKNVIKNNPAICCLGLPQCCGLVHHEEVSADHHDKANGGQLASHCLDICVILPTIILKQKRLKAIDCPIKSRILVKTQS